MKVFLLLLIISIVFCVFSLPWLIRLYARMSTDKIIYGHRPGSEKLLSRCLSILTWSNEWISTNEKPDDYRINRLRALLDEMQNPHT